MGYVVQSSKLKPAIGTESIFTKSGRRVVVISHDAAPYCKQPCVIVRVVGDTKEMLVPVNSLQTIEEKHGG
jgi:hypothetical protein